MRGIISGSVFPLIECTGADNQMRNNRQKTCKNAKFKPIEHKRKSRMPQFSLIITAQCACAQLWYTTEPSSYDNPHSFPPHNHHCQCVCWREVLEQFVGTAEWMKVHWFKVRSKTDLESAYSNTPCKQIQPSSRIETLNGPRVRALSVTNVTGYHVNESSVNHHRHRRSRHCTVLPRWWLSQPTTRQHSAMTTKTMTVTIYAALVGIVISYRSLSHLVMSCLYYKLVTKRSLCRYFSCESAILQYNTVHSHKRDRTSRMAIEMRYTMLRTVRIKSTEYAGPENGEFNFQSCKMQDWKMKYHKMRDKVHFTLWVRFRKRKKVIFVCNVLVTFSPL